MAFSMFYLLILALAAFCDAAKKHETNGEHGEHGHHKPLKPNAISEFSDGNCYSNITAYLAPNMEKSFFDQPRVWYIPMCSDHLCASYADAIQGHPIKNLTELANFKMTCEKITTTKNLLLFRGWGGKKLLKNCPYNNTIGNQVVCHPVWGSHGSNPSVEALSQGNFVYTDNNTTLLIVRCSDGQYKDFEVFCTEKVIPADQLVNVKNTLAALNFDPNHYYYQTYD